MALLNIKFTDEDILKIAQSLASGAVTSSFGSGPTSSGFKARLSSEVGGKSRYGAQYAHDGEDLDNTLAKAMQRDDKQPLHRYTRNINKPTDQTFSNKTLRNSTSLSHMEDKRITHGRESTGRVSSPYNSGTSYLG